MNKNYERVLCLLLSMVMCVGLLAPAVHAEEDASNPTVSTTETETDPTNSSDPTDSSDPSDPIIPEDPSESVPPTNPSDPSVPAEPSDPSDPSDPAETTVPSDPSDPTDSEETEPEEPKEFTITFVIGEGANMFNDAKPVTAAPGTEIQLNDPHYAPRKDGYVFDGWFTDEACVENQVSGLIKLEANMTLYAKWELMVAPNHNTVVGEIARGRYTGDAYSDPTQPDFIKISHPYYPANSNQYNPAGKNKNDPMVSLHEYEVFNDGLLDYLGRLDGKSNPPAKGQPNQVAASGVPLEDILENELGGVIMAEGQGDRGMSYSWSGQGYGDWMYVTLQFNPTGQTGEMMDMAPSEDDVFQTYGGDYFANEPDYGDPGCALCKINVKTGEVKVLMSTAKNHLNTQFRNSIPFKGKLYFCGSVNHMPSIYEIDPETDAFQCVYQDESMVTYPGGMGAAWAEAQKTKLCPAIRGMTTFILDDQEYLVISCVGMDANPYIAVSADPSSGQFTKIAYNYEPDTDNTVPGELRGYAACHLDDSIFGGSIWEMVQIDNKLYVALCTGTPETAEYIGDEMVSMQSFALIEGVLKEGGKVDHRSDWTWNVIAGDQERDNAPYTFGFDPERTRAGACNLQVFNGDLYIGEYNDNQIGFKNLNDNQFEFIIRNVEQSISLYRLNQDTHEVELVMGTPTQQFPEPLATITDSEHNLKRDESGFGRRENQYVWQSKVFDGKLYLGTMDITGLLLPLGLRIGNQQFPGGQKMAAELDTFAQEAESAAAAAPMSEDGSVSLAQEMVDMREFYELRKTVSTMADFVEEHVTDTFVPLPESAFDVPAMIEVDSPATLYAALMAISDIMTNENWNAEEILMGHVRLGKQADEVVNYIHTTNDEIPTTLMNVAQTFEEEEYTTISDFQTLMEYMKGGIAGFDLLVSENGVDFKAVTRTGMGDPFNSGLRVFATNVKEDEQETNPWMTIGSANQFYGTQIWRMEADDLNTANVTDAKMFVEVRFMDENGEQIGQATESDLGRGQLLHVDVSETEISADVVKNLYPDGALPQENTPAAFPIQESEGTHYIEVPVIKAFSLRFAVNGGKRLETAKVPAGETIHVMDKEYIPHKPGSAFVGWYTDQQFSEDSRVNEIVMDSHKVVYAKWVEQKYTVHFETNGGSELEDLTVKEFTEIHLRDFVTTRENYTFDGWYRDKELTEPIETVKLTSDLTVYAKWVPYNPFTDVTAEDYFYTPVLWAVRNHITSGTTETTFSPEEVCIRADAVMFLWSMAGRPEPETTVNPFSDVSEQDYFYKAVLWAVENEITAGVGNGKFGPMETCERAQIMTFLWKYQGAPKTDGEVTFSDVKAGDYFYDAVQWAVKNNITAGMGNNEFGSEEDCTRAHIVTFLWRAAGSPEIEV